MRRTVRIIGHKADSLDTLLTADRVVSMVDLVTIVLAFIFDDTSPPDPMRTFFKVEALSLPLSWALLPDKGIRLPG